MSISWWLNCSMAYKCTNTHYILQKRVFPAYSRPNTSGFPFPLIYFLHPSFLLHSHSVFCHSSGTQCLICHTPSWAAITLSFSRSCVSSTHIPPALNSLSFSFIPTSSSSSTPSWPSHPPQSSTALTVLTSGLFISSSILHLSVLTHLSLYLSSKYIPVSSLYFSRCDVSHPLSNKPGPGQINSMLWLTWFVLIDWLYVTCGCNGTQVLLFVVFTMHHTDRMSTSEKELITGFGKVIRSFIHSNLFYNISVFK